MSSTKKARSFNGKTPVDSPWSSGYHRTKFTISLSEDNMVTITPAQYSRSPDFNDVWNALELFLLETIHIKPTSRKPSGLEKITTSVGANSVGLNGYYIGRSHTGKFSLRGRDSIPLEVLQVLLYPLDGFLQEVGIY